MDVELEVLKERLGSFYEEDKIKALSKIHSYSKADPVLVGTVCIRELFRLYSEELIKEIENSQYQVVLRKDIDIQNKLLVLSEDTLKLILATYLKNEFVDILLDSMNLENWLDTDFNLIVNVFGLFDGSKTFYRRISKHLKITETLKNLLDRRLISGCVFNNIIRENVLLKGQLAFEGIFEILFKYYREEHSKSIFRNEKTEIVRTNVQNGIIKKEQKTSADEDGASGLKKYYNFYKNSLITLTRSVAGLNEENNLKEESRTFSNHETSDNSTYEFRPTRYLLEIQEIILEVLNQSNDSQRYFVEMEYYKFPDFRDCGFDLKIFEKLLDGRYHSSQTLFYDVFLKNRKDNVGGIREYRILYKLFYKNESVYMKRYTGGLKNLFIDTKLEYAYSLISVVPYINVRINRENCYKIMPILMERYQNVPNQDFVDEDDTRNGESVDKTLHSIRCFNGDGAIDLKISVFRLEDIILEFYFRILMISLSDLLNGKNTAENSLFLLLTCINERDQLQSADYGKEIDIFALAEEVLRNPSCSTPDDQMLIHLIYLNSRIVFEKYKYEETDGFNSDILFLISLENKNIDRKKKENIERMRKIRKHFIENKILDEYCDEMIIQFITTNIIESFY